MEIQEEYKGPPTSFYSYFFLANKQNFRIFCDYSTADDFKQRLSEVIRTEPPKIPDFHEIYTRLKAFALKNLEMNYGTIFLLLLGHLFDEDNLARLDVSYLWDQYPACLNLFTVCIRKCLCNFEGDRLANFIQKLIDTIILPLHDLCCESSTSEILQFDPILNILISSGQKKFESMQFAVHKTPKTIFFFRIFFNVPFKLLPYSKFRLSTKTWLKLLEVCTNAIRYFSRNRDSYSEIAAQLINDIVKFLAICFQNYTSVDRDKDPYQRETILNEVSIYLLSNAELVAEYFYTTKDNLIANYVHLTTFLFKSGRLETLEKIDKQLMISALVRSQQEVLKVSPSSATSGNAAIYLDEKERIAHIIDVISGLSPASLNNLVTDTNVRHLLLCVSSLRELHGKGITLLSQSTQDSDKNNAIKYILEPFMKEDMSPNGLKSLLNYSSQSMNEGERPVIFAFLERVQFDFSAKDVEVNKDFVLEVLRELNLKQHQCDPYYAKFCCFFILKIPSSAIPEGLAFQEMFKMIFSALYPHFNLLTDLLKNLPLAFYSLCYRGSLTHTTHIQDILKELGNLACVYISQIEDDLVRIREKAKGTKDYNKLLGELLELHYLLSWTIQLPLKISQGYFDEKKLKSTETSTKNGKQVESEPVVVMRKYCKNCGYARKNKKKRGLEYCKYCGLYIEDYVFKNYPEKMLRNEKLNTILWENLKIVKGRIGKRVEERSKRVKEKEKGRDPHDLWSFIHCYDFVILNVLELLAENYDLI